MLARIFLSAAALAVSASVAGAASISMNESVLAEGATLADCKAAARAAIARAELSAMPEAEVSVFGAGPNGLIAAIYCLPERGIAVVGIAGDSSQETGPVLRRILGYLDGG